MRNLEESHPRSDCIYKTILLKFVFYYNFCHLIWAPGTTNSHPPTGSPSSYYSNQTRRTKAQTFPQNHRKPEIFFKLLDSVYKSSLLPSVEVIDSRERVILSLPLDPLCSLGFHAWLRHPQSSNLQSPDDTVEPRRMNLIHCRGEFLR